MRAIIACNSSAIPPLKPHIAAAAFISAKHLPFLGRRKLCCDVLARLPVPPLKPWDNDKEDADILVERHFVQENSSLTTRRTFFTRLSSYFKAVLSSICNRGSISDS